MNIVVQSEYSFEEGIGVGIRLVDQGQVQLDQHLLHVQAKQRLGPVRGDHATRQFDDRL